MPTVRPSSVARRRAARIYLAIGFVLGSAIALRSTTSFAAERDAAGNHDFFEKKIRPVLIEHCYKCHSAAAGKAEGGLALDTRRAMRAGGSSGPAVVPSDEEKSLILAAIRHDGLAMPPDRKLPPDVIADFERWIADGAADPREGDAPKAKPTVDYAEAKKHWAFQPLSVVAPPATANAAWPLDPIDRYILGKLEATGPWRAMLLEYIADGEPATDLGAAEAAWHAGLPTS